MLGVEINADPTLKRCARRPGTKTTDFERVQSMFVGTAKELHNMSRIGFVIADACSTYTSLDKQIMPLMTESAFQLNEHAINHP